VATQLKALYQAVDDFFLKPVVSPLLILLIALLPSCTQNQTNVFDTLHRCTIRLLIHEGSFW
jgi:hypothetical protein